jgi:predicted unusual protein kinase regulating ubiquinone biosynthesis (AarF/ABC1/UbiB family)
VQADICRAWEREAHKELDLTYEVAATTEVGRFLASKRASSRTVSLVPELSAPSAFVMGWEQLHCKVDDKEALAVHGVDATALARHFAHVMCAQIFELGFFNADPHPGNVALRFDESTGTARLLLLDWGWTHRLTRAELRGWRDLALALYDSDVERASEALAALGYRTNQDERDAARNVHFMAFILRDASDQETARRETKERMTAIRDRMQADKAAGVREKGGRKIQGLPDSFMFVIRCIGMIRGTCAHLGVSLPLVDIMATYARRGAARDRRARRVAARRSSAPVS